MAKKSLVKIIAAWLLFVALHFTYKIIPSAVTQFIGCQEETLYTHMKMAFFSYLIISACFYMACAFRGEKEPVFAVLLANCIYPYMAFFIWMLVPAFFGQIHDALWEILYSNIILIICLFMTVSFEQNMSGIKWNQSGKTAVVFFFAVSMLLFSVMTVKKPAIEIFETHSRGQAHE